MSGTVFKKDICMRAEPNHGLKCLAAKLGTFLGIKELMPFGKSTPVYKKFLHVEAKSSCVNLVRTD